MGRLSLTIYRVYIIFGIIYTSIKEGTIEIAYQAIILDEEGLPVIPDNSKFIRALEAYIKKQWFTILFDTGTIQGPILQNVQQEYAWAVGACETEYQKMISDFGQDKTDKAIKFFDEYIEDKGYKSKSHNLAMRRWVFKAVEEQEHKQGVANGRGNNITISAPNSRQRADYEEVDKLLWG